MSEERYRYSDDIESIVDMKDSTDGLGIELTTSDVVLRLNRLEAESEALRKREKRWSAALYDMSIFKAPYPGGMFDDFKFDHILGVALLTEEKPETPISDVPITP